MPTIETTQLIAAPPDRVWEVLTDLKAYPEWNPFIVEGTGMLREGERLELRMRPPGGKAMTFKPKVLKADPCHELRWLGRLLVPGLFDGEHWFQLEPTDTGTLLTQGERFTGVLPPLMGKMLSRTERGFVELNKALRERAETR